MVSNVVVNFGGSPDFAAVAAADFLDCDLSFPLLVFLPGGRSLFAFSADHHQQKDIR